MGRYASRDEALRVLLSSQEGWGKLRDMELFEAADLFSSGGSDTDRLGTARTYLALADAFASLDELLLATESVYLDSLGDRAGPLEQARGGLVRIRRGDLAPARSLFAKGPPPAARGAWAVGAAGLAAADGRAAEGAALPAGVGDGEADLASVAGYAWAGRAGRAGGPFGRAARALAAGDFGGALTVLQRLELARAPRAAGPDLFTYLLLRRACAGLASKALGEPTTPDAAYLAGLAREHLGEDAAAVALYARAEAAQQNGLDAAWLFSPCLGAREAARLAAARRGGLLARRGSRDEAAAAWQKALGAGEPGPLARATVAEMRAGGSAQAAAPDVVAEAAAAVTEAAEVPPLLPKDGAGGDLLPSLYPARTAAVARAAASVYRRAGQSRRALEVLERAHRKATGYRPDFANDVAFLVDLARSYADAGDYAPAVAVLFDLSRQYPQARLAYESLKRAYAARTGGETQPRY